MSLTVEFKGSWTGRSAGGCFGYGSWRFNPQYLISSEEDQDIEIVLKQGVRTKYYLGIIISPSNGKNRRQLILEPNKVTTYENEQAQTITHKFTVPVNTSYVVIPCTYSPFEEGTFILIFKSKSKLNITELSSPEQDTNFVSAKGEWKGETAAGHLRNPNFENNPQFGVVASPETRNAIILLLQSPPLEGNENDSIGFYVYESPNLEKKLTRSQLTPKEIKANAEFMATTEALVEFTMLPNKNYVIIPATFDSTNENRFELIIFSESKVEMHPLPYIAPVKQVVQVRPSVAVAAPSPTPAHPVKSNVNLASILTVIILLLGIIIWYIFA